MCVIFVVCTMIVTVHHRCYLCCYGHCICQCCHCHSTTTIAINIVRKMELHNMLAHNIVKFCVFSFPHALTLTHVFLHTHTPIITLSRHWNKLNEPKNTNNHMKVLLRKKAHARTFPCTHARRHAGTQARTHWMRQRAREKWKTKREHYVKKMGKQHEEGIGKTRGDIKILHEFHVVC